MTDTTGGASDAVPAEMAEAEPRETAEKPDLMESLANEVAELRDKLLRTLAEMENLRRRTDREVVDARTYGISAFARDVLVVADNMRRALDAAADLRETTDPSVEGLLAGVELTERELLKALEKHGVNKYVPQGEKFDPNLHQAMFEVPDPETPAGTVVQVVQAGYMIGERVLRPALVGVAKGGPKPGAEMPANNNAETPKEPQASK